MHWAQRLLDDHFTLADRLLPDRGWFFEHYTAPDAYFSGPSCAPRALA